MLVEAQRREVMSVVRRRHTLDDITQCTAVSRIVHGFATVFADFNVASTWQQATKQHQQHQQHQQQLQQQQAAGPSSRRASLGQGYVTPEVTRLTDENDKLRALPLSNLRDAMKFVGRWVKNDLRRQSAADLRATQVSLKALEDEMVRGLKKPTHNLSTQTFVKVCEQCTDCDDIPPLPPPTPPPEPEVEVEEPAQPAGKGGRRMTAPPGAIEGKLKGRRMSTVGGEKKKK
jgi:hypothetical protein